MPESRSNLNESRKVIQQACLLLHYGDGGLCLPWHCLHYAGGFSYWDTCKDAVTEWTPGATMSRPILGFALTSFANGTIKHFWSIAPRLDAVLPGHKLMAQNGETTH